MTPDKSQSQTTSPSNGETKASPAHVQAVLETLEVLASDKKLLAALPDEQRVQLLKLAGEVYCPNPVQRRQLVKAKRKQDRAAKIARDEHILGQTGIRTLRRRPVFTTPNYLPPVNGNSAYGGGTTGTDTPPPAEKATPVIADVREARNCYICKQDYFTVHHFYDQLCSECAELNYRKRLELADLKGRVALLTGGRVKIGYQAGIKLLRAGASLIVTTRFPRDSAMRYAAEPDYDQWADRLEIYGLDLRHTPSVEAFCTHVMRTRDRLDFIINNACQTVRRPPDFYAHMMERETGPLRDLPETARSLLGAYEGLRRYHMLPENGTELATQTPAPLAGLVDSAALSQVRLLGEERAAQRDLFPEGKLDQDLQQVDLRDRNSWRLTLAEVGSVELLEVHLINAVAPFVLNARLKPLMLRTPERDKHIVNVSAVEGQFYRKFKTTRHPHTNMAKAALNMMTRTAAADYQADGIHMNSVDTGWVTDEDPAETAARKIREHRFHPPLDIVDGAARIVDPIVDGFNTGVHVWGKFLKDYRPVDW